MTEPRADLRLRSLILVPAVITLAVTLLRLVGELLRWNPALFSREAGGAGAIVGIVWLVPVFGGYFAWKLVQAGHRPGSAGRAIGIPLLAFLMVPAAIAVAMKVDHPFRIAVMGAGCIVATLVGLRAWPALGRTLLAYGLAARIPVVIVMLLAILGGWGTHYELGPPSFPEMAALPKWFWIGFLPQLTLWIAFTVIIGGLVGGLTALAIGRRAAPAALSPAR
jgi:hypothetical protein